MATIFKCRSILLLAMVLASISFADFSQAASPCHLTLVYKDKGKPGYMAKAPSNAGLYKTLYQEVANNINCRLTIKRVPKKRTLYLLEHGEADLYPSTGFDSQRSSYLYYVANGLYRLEYYLGLTPNDVTKLENISDIANHGLSWIFEAGNTTLRKAEALNLPSDPIVGLTTDRAIKMLSLGRRVFYRMIQEDYYKYLETKGLDDLNDLNIATHLSCCSPKSHKLYTGISRFSPIYREEHNPDFDSLQVVSAENFPYRLARDSIAFKVAQEVEHLESSGRVDELFQEYIVSQGHTP